MDQETENIKKRKFLIVASDELSLPAAKHKCYEVDNNDDDDKENNSKADHTEVLDMQAESSHGSNCFPGDSQPSASWANSASLTCESDYFTSESRTTLSGAEDTGEIITSSESFPCTQDGGWANPLDFVVESANAEHFKDGNQSASEELEEFLSCSGLNTNLYGLSSEILSTESEAHSSKRKPTIDQEFEEYFSSLML